ncbi:MAG: zinc-ribbon domain-containing protein [Lachnospiraceae bacterium]|nr:zinc-ribbon domain-containing protein [Lachnospiraceae bacterium]
MTQKGSHEWQAVVSSRSNGNGCPFCYQEQRKSN